jgi:hypothetical protein
MSYDPSHRMPPRQERWPTATPAEGWPSYRDGEQEDLRYRAQGATAGYRQQAVATTAYPAVTNGSAWSGNGYPGAADGYAGAADDFDRVQDGSGRVSHGYSGGSVGYDWADAAYAGEAGGYDWSGNGYGSSNGYGGHARGYAEPADGYAGGAYLGPGSYVEPGAALTAPDAGVRPDRWQAEQERRREAGRRGPVVGAVTELLAIGVMIGVSTLAAALLKSAASPVSAMGAVFAERTPAALRNAVTHHFGAQGRTVLLLGMYLTFAVVAIVIGMMARRDAAAAVAGVAAFTLFAAFVVITRPGGHMADLAPVVIGGMAGVAAALWLFRASAPHEVQRTAALRHGRGGARRRTR